jgi:hypothetical protein
MQWKTQEAILEYQRGVNAYFDYYSKRRNDEDRHHEWLIHELNCWGFKTEMIEKESIIKLEEFLQKVIQATVKTLDQ